MPLLMIQFNVLGYNEKEPSVEFLILDLLGKRTPSSTRPSLHRLRLHVKPIYKET